MSIQMNITTHAKSSYEPDSFGPAFWFTLHNGSTIYPENPTFVVKQGMKQLLINLPFLIPCIKCREHYFNYVKNTNLDQVVNSRENLFSFIVTLHNYVNQNNGKPMMDINVAKQLYGYYDKEHGSKIYITYN